MLGNNSHSNEFNYTYSKVKINTRYSGLINHETGKSYSIDEVQSYCKETNEPLVAQYDLEQPLNKGVLQGRPFNMWRYEELLPITDRRFVVTLGEGFTPLMKMKQLAQQYSLGSLLLKEEGVNPTGSFKARGLSMAVSKAYELGIDSFAIPTAGNAGSALSAYCAKAGLEANIYMPKLTPKMFQLDCSIMGANVCVIDGNISDCGVAMRRDNAEGKWWDVTTLKEPFRLEGKKTMGFEIAEQLNWKLPDVLIYPTGGGTGLIGIWKGFHELQKLGWIDEIPTRMVAVQTTGCDPIVRAFEEGRNFSVPYEDPDVTIANGLRVPHAFGHKLIMKTIYESDGYAVRVSDDQIRDALREFAGQEGIFLSPEGAAVWHAARHLKSTNRIKDGESVLLLNTGSGYKYAENLW